MANRNKQKGKRFEDKVASIIRKYWGLKKGECHRALSSGTFQSDYSDIVFNTETIHHPHVVIECKKRKSFSVRQFIEIGGSEFQGWWKQLTQGAEKYRKEFGVMPLRLLVWGYDRGSIFVTYLIDEFQEIGKYYLAYNGKTTYKFQLTTRNICGEFRTQYLEDWVKNIQPIRRNSWSAD